MSRTQVQQVEQAEHPQQEAGRQTQIADASFLALLHGHRRSAAEERTDATSLVMMAVNWLETSLQMWLLTMVAVYVAATATAGAQVAAAVVWVVAAVAAAVAAVVVAAVAAAAVPLAKSPELY